MRTLGSFDARTNEHHEVGHPKEHTELRTGTVDSAFAGFGEYVKDRHSVKAPIVLRGCAL